MILIFENTSFIFMIMSVRLQLNKTMFHICFGSIICLIIMLTLVMNCFCHFIHDVTLIFIASFLWIKINMKMPYSSTVVGNGRMQVQVVWDYSLVISSFHIWVMCIGIYMLKNRRGKKL